MKFFTSFILVLFFTACASSHREEPSFKGKIVTLSTTAMIQDIVKEVGGEKIESLVLIQGGVDPHSYELVKGDDEKIADADVVFLNGLQLEHGASLRYALSCHPHAVAVGDYLLQNFPHDILYEKGQIDPHVWMDISLWAKIVDPIIAKLSEIDPLNKSYYEERGSSLKLKMLEVHSTVKMKIGSIAEDRRYLVTSHDAFSYFTKQYLAVEEEAKTQDWKKRFAAPEGLAPDGQLGVVDLQKIVDYLVMYQVAVVFPESNVSQDSLKKIIFACNEKNRPIRFSFESLYGDCMGEASSYLDMIDHNVNVLVAEWEKD
jgi:manganese/zinc/iron transport system substrate-binding protein